VRRLEFFCVKFNYRRKHVGWAWQYMHVIPDTQEAEVRNSWITTSLGKKVKRPNVKEQAGIDRSC
jgi:hypothetical protein